MNLNEALKAVSAAVGDGKIVPLHAYVEVERRGVGVTIVRATDGSMSVTADTFNPAPSFCVRYDALCRALERDGATLSASADGNSLIVRAGRSRVTLRCAAPGSFPAGMQLNGLNNEQWQTEPGFITTLADLSKFTAGSDGHIWQMGVHFNANLAFAFGPFAAIFKPYETPFDITIPPWAAKFIASQAGPPHLLNGTNTFLASWPEVQMTSTFLIESAPDSAHTFIDNLPRNGGVPVPANLKEIVERLKAYEVKRFRLADGKITYVSEQLEIEEEVDIDTPPRTWGTEQMLDALQHAETISLTGERAVWHGGGYHGVFSGMTG